jgi:hypothetical protein
MRYIGGFVVERPGAVVGIPNSLSVSIVRFAQVKGHGEFVVKAGEDCFGLVSGGLEGGVEFEIHADIIAEKRGEGARHTEERRDAAACIFGDQQNEKQTPQGTLRSSALFPGVFKDMSDCQRGLAEMGGRMFQKFIFTLKIFMNTLHYWQHTDLAPIINNLRTPGSDPGVRDLMGKIS